MKNGKSYAACKWLPPFTLSLIKIPTYQLVGVSLHLPLPSLYLLLFFLSLCSLCLNLFYFLACLCVSIYIHLKFGLYISLLAPSLSLLSLSPLFSLSILYLSQFLPPSMCHPSLILSTFQSPHSLPIPSISLPDVQFI